MKTLYRLFSILLICMVIQCGFGNLNSLNFDSNQNNPRLSNYSNFKVYPNSSVTNPKFTTKKKDPKIAPNKRLKFKYSETKVKRIKNRHHYTNKTLQTLKIDVIGSAYDVQTKHSLNKSYKIVVNSKNPNWVTIAYRNPVTKHNNKTTRKLGNMEMDIIVNGKIVVKHQVYNKYTDKKNIPSNWAKKYSGANLYAMENYAPMLNCQWLNKTSVWNLINKDKALKPIDKQFIHDCYPYFSDTITTTLAYPKQVKKTDKISYLNGWEFFENMNTKLPKEDLKKSINVFTFLGTASEKSIGGYTDFECIQSFAITQTKITKNILKTWQDKKSLFPSKGFLKASYGTFLTALTTIYSSDYIADVSKTKLKVDWIRTVPTLVMNGVSDSNAYINTPDASMGRKVTGKIGDIRAFNFANSLMLSVIEDKILNSEAFPVNSVLMGMGRSLIGGRVIISEVNNTTISVHRNDKNDVRMDVDPNTWIVKDIIGPYKGAITQTNGYCFNTLQTNLILKLVDNINKDKCFWISAVGGITTTVGTTMLSLYLKGPDKPFKTLFGGIIAGTGLFIQLYDSDLYRQYNQKNLIKFTITTVPTLIPIMGVDTITGKLTISYISATTIKQKVTQVPLSWEGYVISTTKLRSDLISSAFKDRSMYMTTIQYVKHGEIETILRTSIGKTPKEAVKNFIKENIITESLNLVVDTYFDGNNSYVSKKFKNVTEYINA